MFKLSCKKMQNNWKIVILFLLVANFFEVKCNDEYLTFDSFSKDWWETASFYQIYPRSFKDSNGDGIGDLNGIIQQLPYLKETGITATWLSPIFKSPMADFGYDISDFFSIQPEYGTMEDFDRLIAEAHKLNIKVFMDFVPNHSSDENEWFIKSVNRVPGFEDFYVWHPGYPDVKNASHRLPPSNWISVFHKSAWEWNEKRQEFYLHQFYNKQPDLNYRNPDVVRTMKNVLRFWLDRGVAGFRIDAVPHLFEIPKDSSDRFQDEPRNNDNNDPDDYGYLNHIYTTNQPETIDMVYQWREVLDEYKQQHGGDTRVMLTEAYSSLDVLKQYFGNGVRNGSQIPFNFQLIERIRNESSAIDYVACISDWMNILPIGHPANWVIGNHDNNRVASRLGTDRIDLINILLLTLPGISITYNGEEIGMIDQWISWNDTVDPAACNTNPSIYQYFTRDPERTPFQWNDDVNAGFSTATKTWLPVADNYKKVNVEKEKSSESSHLKVYLDLQKLRREPTMLYGQVSYGTLSNQVLAVIRELDGETTYVSVLNVGPFKETVNIKQLKPSLSDEFECVIVSDTSTRKKSDIVTATKVLLGPKEALVLRPVARSQRTRLSDYFSYQVISTSIQNF